MSITTKYGRVMDLNTNTSIKSYKSKNILLDRVQKLSDQLDRAIDRQPKCHTNYYNWTIVNLENGRYTATCHLGQGVHFMASTIAIAGFLVS